MNHPPGEIPKIPNFPASFNLFLTQSSPTQNAIEFGKLS
jgi:hypothetical protein